MSLRLCTPGFLLWYLYAAAPAVSAVPATKRLVQREQTWKP